MKIRIFLVTTIFILAAFLRFNQISRVPPGLYWDEVSIGYNAYSILTTGKDEHGKTLPLTFRAFGEYKLPAYIYSTVLPIKLFGPSEATVRFTSALAGFLTVILLYFLVLELFGNYRLAVLSSFLLTISPWHLQFSRAAYEANLALFFTVLAALLFFRGQKNTFLLLISAVFFSTTIYTYSTSRLFTPFIILSLVILRGKSLWKVKKLHRFLVSSLLIFLVTYLSLFLLPNLWNRFNVVSAFSGVSINLWPDIFLKNYFSYFSFDFLFFRGDQIARHGVNRMGNLYFFEIPLVLLGLYQLLKNGQKHAKFFTLSWFILSPLSAALTQPSPHSLRSLNMVIPLVIISGLGLAKIIDWTSHLKKHHLKLTAYGVTFAVIFYFFINYLHLYYNHYPKVSALAWQDGNKEMAQEVTKRAQDYDQILVSDFLGQTYIYILFYGQVNPNFYRQNLTPEGFGKYQFIGKNWPEKTIGDKNLWVLSFDDKFNPPGKLLKEIKIASGDTIYRIWETK